AGLGTDAQGSDSEEEERGPRDERDSGVAPDAVELGRAEEISEDRDGRDQHHGQRELLVQVSIPSPRQGSERQRQKGERNRGRRTHPIRGLRSGGPARLMEQELIDPQIPSNEILRQDRERD